MMLWTCEIDLASGEIKRHNEDLGDGDYPTYSSEEESEGFGGAGYATYEESCEGERIYAESVVSQADADRLVRIKCKKMFWKFHRAFMKMDKEQREANNEV